MPASGTSRTSAPKATTAPLKTATIVTPRKYPRSERITPPVIICATGSGTRLLSYGAWSATHEGGIAIEFLVDRLSLGFAALSAAIAGVVAAFSNRYLHREPGFLRFFLLLHLFAFGSLLAFAAGSFDLLVGGWELVGITSVLLIAFFQQRTAPVENGLRVFAVYRACDIGLLVGVFAMHNWAGTASFAGGLPALSGNRASMVCLLLLLAASGKAAQVFQEITSLKAAMAFPNASLVSTV